MMSYTEEAELIGRVISPELEKAHRMMVAYHRLAEITYERNGKRQDVEKAIDQARHAAHPFCRLRQQHSTWEETFRKEKFKGKHNV